MRSESQVCENYCLGETQMQMKDQDGSLIIC